MSSSKIVVIGQVDSEIERVIKQAEESLGIKAECTGGRGSIFNLINSLQESDLSASDKQARKKRFFKDVKAVRSLRVQLSRNWSNLSKSIRSAISTLLQKSNNRERSFLMADGWFDETNPDHWILFQEQKVCITGETIEITGGIEDEKIIFTMKSVGENSLWLSKLGDLFSQIKRDKFSLQPKSLTEDVEDYANGIFGCTIRTSEGDKIPSIHDLGWIIETDVDIENNVVTFTLS